MTDTDLRKAATLIREIEGFNTEVATPGPASKEQIQQLEQIINIELPTAYKVFLHHYGGIHVQDDKIAGIWNGDFDTQSRSCVHACTLEARQEIGLNHAYVVLDIEDDEYFVCLDTSRIKDGDCPVIGIDGPPMKGRSVKASTFTGYLRAFLERHLSVAKDVAEWEQARLRE